MFPTECEHPMDIVDPERRSRIMARIGPMHTQPELRVRRLAHKVGLRFRLHRKDLPGRPDLVLSRFRTVIFVHGCFWHRHSGCKKCYMPRTRVTFWKAKFDSNMARDARDVALLRAAGWRVITIWECETKNLRTMEDRLKAWFHNTRLELPDERPSGIRKRTLGKSPRAW
jgi:DNA mismatch endonuclease, patch repair protein